MRLLCVSLLLVACTAPAPDFGDEADMGRALASGDMAQPFGCERDTDCKGDRICVARECVGPGVGDLATRPDAAIPSDMSTPLDLAAPPDLLRPADLAFNRNCVGGSCGGTPSASCGTDGWACCPYAGTAVRCRALGASCSSIFECFPAWPKLNGQRQCENGRCCLDKGAGCTYDSDCCSGACPQMGNCL